MSEIEKYIQAAIRDNTRKSYRVAVEHYEDIWGGFLPATTDSILLPTSLILHRRWPSASSNND